MQSICRKGCWTLLVLCARAAVLASGPALSITQECQEFVPLFEALPANECFVTSLIRREVDDLVFGATCGKKKICLFRFNPTTSEVTLLDALDALWWDEPRVAAGPQGDLYLAARRSHDKQFVFERLRERPQTPGATYQRRDAVPAPGDVDPQAPGMPIRHYSPEGRFVREIPLPKSLDQDGVGALAVYAQGEMLCGLSAPGGRLFTISLKTGQSKDYGEVIPFPKHHHTRPISRALLTSNDGTVYFCGSNAKASGDKDDDEEAAAFLFALDPQTEKLEALNARLPAVIGRRRLASIDAATKLPDGTFLGGTSDGYLFHFDPATESIDCLGKPLRQHNICGLACGADGLVYGAGGQPGGLPRLFAFDPVHRRFHLGISPTGTPPGAGANTFGEIGAVVSTSDGTLVCGERERRGYLLVYRPAGVQLSWVKTFRGEDFRHCLRDRFTDLAAADGGVRLAPTYLISDAMARSSKIHESLSPSVHAKKVFTLRSPCRKAEILFHTGGGTEESPMLIQVNGHEIRHVQDPGKMLTGGWDRETLPGDYLQPGRNELVFAGSGVLLVDADGSGESSFKRQQPAGPWRAGILSPDNDLSGEYVVRVRVDGHPPRGTITSPVIDTSEMAAGNDGGTLPPLVSLRRIRLDVDASIPPQTSIALEVRSGSTPDDQPAQWSDWYPAEAIPEEMQLRRFLQWRAHLASSDAKLTPILREVTVGVSGAATGVNRERIQVVTRPDNNVAVSSYRFSYADPHHPRMRHLREKYKLDDVVAAGKTEVEKFALLGQWTRQQWEGWNENKYNYCPQWDALEILELAPANLGLGMCTHYAAVFAQCATSLGYHARELIIDHHCLVEVWSDQYGKWILQDPGLLPGHAVAFRYEHEGVPINALEMHRRSLAGSAADVTVVPDPPVPLDRMQKQMVQLYVRFGIPLRNDHLYRSEPQELEHGRNQYHWDGYLWWTDSLDPRYPEYSLQTNRPEDFYWTLNKTLITLEDTTTEGVVSIRLSGPVPHLDRFLIRTGDGEWRETGASFEWQLHAGGNRLQAKAVNTMGIEGPANHVELHYAPQPGDTSP